MGQSSPAIALRNAGESDLPLLMAWRSNPDLYRWFREQDGPLKWEDHAAWWRQRQNRKDWLIVVDDGESGSRPVGCVVASRLETPEPEVGVWIGETTLQGLGIGSKAIILVLARLETEGYRGAFAVIKADNIGSRRAFEKAGMSQRPSAQVEWLEYEKTF